MRPRVGVIDFVTCVTATTSSILPVLSVSMDETNDYESPMVFYV